MYRIIIYGLIFGAIYLGIRKILFDWKSRFSEMDEGKRERDLKESKRPDVIDLKQDKDGIFRPGDKKDD